MSNLESDLNATITSAINARIEAEVMSALSGDAVVGQFVAAALAQEVGETGYGRDRKKITFMHRTVSKAIQEITAALVLEVIESERETIEREIRKSLRSYIPNMAAGMVDALAGQAKHASYRISVQPMEDEA